jgi:hypothetical protein
LDVWTFWSRIQDHSAAFVPATSSSAAEDSSSSPAGVFPLLFLKGNTATLIAIGRDREHVAHLRYIALHASETSAVSDKVAVHASLLTLVLQASCRESSDISVQLRFVCFGLLDVQLSTLDASTLRPSANNFLCS